MNVYPSICSAARGEKISPQAVGATMSGCHCRFQENLSDAHLLALDGLGLIPGPEESEERFYERQASALAALFTHEVDGREEALEKLRGVYGCAPEWVRVARARRPLPPWALGAWEESGGCVALRDRHRWAFTFGYTREEVLAHELAHAARCAFPHDHFDEHLCYGLSPRWYRRVLGPLVSQANMPGLIAGASALSAIELALVDVADCEWTHLGWWLAHTLLAFALLKAAVFSALFIRARRCLRAAFGPLGDWFWFRLSQREALRWGIFEIDRFQWLAGSDPRRRLFRAKLLERAQGLKRGEGDPT